MTEKHTKHHKKRGILSSRRNMKPSIILLLIPIGVGLFTLSLVISGFYYNALADIGSKRLITPNWESAVASMQNVQPAYERKFAYYKVKEGQNIDSIAAYFSVNVDKLAQLNPGQIVAGTTIKIPPPEHPYTAASNNGKLNEATIENDHGMLRITQKYNTGQPIVTTIPELMQFLAPYQAITQIDSTTYRLNIAISLQGDIRLDMTPATIKKLEILSPAHNSLCLCMDESSAFIDSVEIVTYDPVTKKPDENYQDGRSFVRMKNGRMDVMNSHLHYLGTALDTAGIDSALHPAEAEGGMYGMAWRISKETLGSQIATGWVENNTFDHNHFGAYTFGASGMTWRGNLFADNDVYGLDPHDDSSNALIEDNVFFDNKKHGFIVSKRCNYNIIRNNISVGNMFHGFMLHEDSAYNIIENNISYGNADNFVIYGSNFNTIKNNKSYNPTLSHVRINEKAYNNFVTDNQFMGGKRAVYVYGGASNVLVQRNTIHKTEKSLSTNGASNILFADNIIDRINYDVSPLDRLIYGANTISPQDVTIPDESSILNSSMVYRDKKSEL
jgi:parallel beta-helix repeat protein